MKKITALVATFCITAGMSLFATVPGACKACHKQDKKAVGPAFNDVASAYGSADSLASFLECVTDKKKASKCEVKTTKRINQMKRQGSIVKREMDKAGGAKALAELIMKAE